MSRWSSNMNRWFFAFACVSGLSFGLPTATGESQTEDAAAAVVEAGEVDFASHIAPVFTAHCLECHGPDDSNGGLNFNDPRTALTELYSGEIGLVPGEPTASEIFRRIVSTDESLRMPPEGDPLPAEQVATIERWIRSGAKWPATEPAGEPADADPRPESNHWAFQPIQRTVPPTGENDAGGGTMTLSSPIDGYLEAERQRLGLAAAEATLPPTLLRRLTFALNGLPPTPEELQAFEVDAELFGIDLTVARWTDRLLARPSYGERWGRHWMDWVRYADTAGDNSDFPIPQAYLYRNWVIDAFNSDLPYDQFLTQQIAGDLLPADSLDEKNRQTIATGYLAMSRRFGSLVERYPWHLTIEDTIDNLGRAVQGLTISCARCHDHKFDPISTREYYGLYGFFASTRYPFAGIELLQVQKDTVPLLKPEEVASAWQEHAPEIEQLEEKLEKQLALCEAMAIEHAAGSANASIEQQRQQEDQLDKELLKARKIGEQLAKKLKERPEIPTAYAVAEAKPIDATIQIKGEPTRPGATVPRGFLRVLGGQELDRNIAESGSGRLELARWIVSPDNPLTARVIVNRVWQRHFGTGLVASVDDFGTRGQIPSHPELLDYLAAELIDSGWSIQHLQRLIVQTELYRLCSTTAEATELADPTNRALARFPRQRLDAESLRDAIKSIAGTLDRRPQTDAYDLPPQKEWKYTQHHPFKQQFHDDRRSVYQFTPRMTTPVYQQTFDGADPNVCTGDRDASVTPLQALFFMNDDFIHQQSTALAKRLLATEDSDEDRLQTLFAWVLTRQPRPDEIRQVKQHMQQAQQVLGEMASKQSRDEVALWASVARSLLRTNEFSYLD